MITIKLTNKDGPEWPGEELTEVIGHKPRARGICFSDQDSALDYVRRLLKLGDDEDESIAPGP